MTGMQQIPGERVREATQEVLSQAPFPQKPGPVGEAFDKFLEWFWDLFSGLGFTPSKGAWEMSMTVVWVLLIALVVVYLGLLIARVIRAGQHSRSEPRQGRELQLQVRVQELREQAQAAELAGDYTLALRLYFFALVIGLGQQGELEYKEAWTNRELLERGDPRPDVLKLLRPLVGELDAHSFGERQTEHREVRHFAQLCERLLVVQGS